jgi:multisubunit Na+/H+ antiporter MnhF subunit
MSRWAKVGLVCIGYLLAFVAGGLAGHMYNARVSALPYDTSGGMYAGGEFLSVLAAFLVVALVPTLLMLWLLRGSTRLWQAVALASLGFACVGLLAVLSPLVVQASHEDPLMLLSLLGLAQLLGVPLWTAAFVLFAFLAPTRPVRRLLIAAIGLELVIGVCALIHWFVPSPPL